MHQLSTAGCSAVKYILFLFAYLIVMSILRIELMDTFVYLSCLGSSNIAMYTPISLFTHTSIPETVTNQHISNLCKSTTDTQNAFNI